MTKLISILLLTALLGCQSTVNSNQSEITQFEGELTFKLISLGNLYNVPDSIIVRFETYLDSIKGIENPSKEDSEFIRVYELLATNDLLYRPIFHLKTDSNAYQTIYVTEKEYEKIKDFDRNELIREGKVVKIKLKGRKVEDGLIIGDEILSLDKVDGKTYWRK